jgi:predicted NBD/HSP70 family sugar kinase
VTLNDAGYSVMSVLMERAHAHIMLYDLNGKLLSGQKLRYQGQQPSGFLEQIIEAAGACMAENTDRRILAIGVAVPGPYFENTDRTLLIPEYPDWDEICVRESFEKAFEIPVVVGQDANLGALGIWEVLGDTTQEEMLVYLALNQGIGAGIVQNGVIFRGGNGTAGEIGHISVNYEGKKCICGNRGCATIEASTTHLMENIRKRVQAGEPSMLPEAFEFDDFLIALEKRDKIASEEYQKIIVYLGRVLLNVNWAYGPQKIVLGGQMARIGERLAADLNQFLDENLAIPQEHRAKLLVWDRSVHEMTYGAGLYAMEYVFHHLELFQKKEAAQHF